ncbi:hypothetical protein [Novosphingobium profundi]|uniref:YkvI family membrane protein n=1 Tax=Novosphingobium profundi TaxID=1774954 RepID=UPI001CFD9917|nr:hypothetical protein [Novosphingobium profundi]
MTLAAAFTDRFQRFLLPGLAFKGVIIGGGYATGRELAEFFLPAGPWGGLTGIAIAMLLWSATCALTFLLAHRLKAYDYRTFFTNLLGRGAIAFELVYCIFLVLILAVFGAAAAAIGTATLALPPLAGTLALMIAIALVTAFGNSAVERLFTWASLLLYTVYVAFLVFALDSFGSRIAETYAHAQLSTGNWLFGGVTYAGYNIIGAVMVLPMLRHLTGKRDAVIAGLLAGPLAVLPAVLFFISMAAFTPQIAGLVLPSDFLLTQMGRPLFHAAFQTMIFAALLESGVGGVHALNERLVTVWVHHRGAPPGAATRGLFTIALLSLCMLIADRIGLVTLIAQGYRALSLAIILVFVLPLFTLGAWQMMRRTPPSEVS